MRMESLRLASIDCMPLESNMDDEVYYQVESTGAIVTLSSSVSLIYFYCSRLPSDWLVICTLLLKYLRSLCACSENTYLVLNFVLSFS